MNLSGKTALVTGAGRGIGQGCALELATAGANLIVNDRPGGPDLAGTAEQIRALGRKCWAIEADVFTREGCESLVSQVIHEVGQIDILISNPARSKRGDFLTYDPGDFEQIVMGTLVAGFHMGQLVARQMAAQGSGGKIVFISSVHAERPYARSVAYNAAKAGLNHMAATMAVELCQHRINVNTIDPGWIDTPGERISFGEERVRQAGPELPLGRLGTPRDIGQAVVFLCSESSDYVTGSVLRVDGGFVFRDIR